MDQSRTLQTDGKTDGSSRTAERKQRWRLVPPAITPVELSDIGAGIVSHLRNQGRDQFRAAIESYLNANQSATYTSYRRTLAGCFHELIEKSDGSRTEVLIPAFCSSDFQAAIEGVGLETVRYDVDPETLALDVESLASARGEKTLAIVAVNVLGYGSPMRELTERFADDEITVIEALGYALGTAYEGKPLGTFGDIAVLNFQQGKPIPVGGGMVISHDPTHTFSDAGRPKIGANVGRLTGYAMLSKPRPYYVFSRTKELLESAGIFKGRVTTHPEAKFDVEYAPPFATISDFQGAIAQRVFDNLGDHRRLRARTANYYIEALSTCPRVTTIDPVDGLSNLQHVRFPLIARTETLRDQILEALRDVGIQATKLYDWPVIDPDRYPGAAALQRTNVALPTHPFVDARDRRLAVDVIRNVVSAGDS